MDAVIVDYDVPVEGEGLMVAHALNSAGIPAITWTAGWNQEIHEKAGMPVGETLQQALSDAGLSETLEHLFVHKTQANRLVPILIGLDNALRENREDVWAEVRQQLNFPLA